METANQLQSVLSMIGALVIFILILVLAYFATKYIGRRYGTTGASGGRYVEVLERVAFGPDRALFVVRAGGKILLLGATAHHVELITELDPYSVDDLLTAHGIMTRGLVEESGMFRTRPVGVVDQEGHVLHFGTLPQYVHDLVMELLDWAKSSDLHMLIRSCVFHYELELIHPFADGNGRVGRLWHTLLLSKWNPVFAWLPVESIIHDHQQEYYDAINASNDAGESTAFIEFMLSTIKASLIDAIHTSDATSDGKLNKKALRWQKIEQFLQTHEYIMNADVRELCGVSAATANRLLTSLVKNGKLVKAHQEGHWGYHLGEHV